MVRSGKNLSLLILGRDRKGERRKRERKRNERIHTKLAQRSKWKGYRGRERIRKDSPSVKFKQNAKWIHFSVVHFVSRRIFTFKLSNITWLTLGLNAWAPSNMKRWSLQSRASSSNLNINRCKMVSVWNVMIQSSSTSVMSDEITAPSIFLYRGGVCLSRLHSFETLSAAKCHSRGQLRERMRKDGEESEREREESEWVSGGEKVAIFS